MQFNVICPEAGDCAPPHANRMQIRPVESAEHSASQQPAPARATPAHFVCDTVRRLTIRYMLCRRRSGAGASRLQLRSRAVAAFTSVWLVVCGILASHHEATVVHVSDGAGGYAHAPGLDGHHTGRQSDVHGPRTQGGDVGDCALLTAFHQAASAQVTAPAVVTTARATHVQDVPRPTTVAVVAAVYRLAPKTSPPSVA